MDSNEEYIKNKDVQSASLSKNPMLEHLPTGREIYRGIKASKGRFNGNNLSINVPISMVVNTRTKGPKVWTQSGYIHIENRNNPVFEPLMDIDKDMDAIGVQKFADAKKHLAEWSKKDASNFKTYGDDSFDHRALMAVCGYYATKASMRAEAQPIAAANTPVIKIGDGIDALGVGSYVMTNGMYMNDDEYVTLLALLKMCGVTSFYDLSGVYPNQAVILGGTRLAKYCLRLFAVVMEVADSLFCGSEHAIAFASGCFMAANIHSHTDEGGWIRRLFRTVSYPPVRGIIPKPSLDQVLMIPTLVNVETRNISRYTFSIWFTVVRCISAADPCAEYKEGRGWFPTIVEKDELAEDRPSNFVFLREKCMEWFSNLSVCVSKCFGLLETQDRRGVEQLKHYFVRNRVDRHLNNKYVMPFYLIEPTFLSVFNEVDEKYTSYITKDRKGSIEYYPDKKVTVKKGVDYAEMYGYPAAGTRSLITMFNCNFRDLGFMTWHSFAMNRDDGLVNLIPHTVAKVGYGNTKLLFVNNNTPNYSGRLWSHSDNPLIGPMEGIAIGLPTTAKIVYPSRPTWFTVDEGKQYLVEFMLGRCSIKENEGWENARSEKQIPKTLKLNADRLVWSSSKITRYNGGEFDFEDDEIGFDPYIEGDDRIEDVDVQQFDKYGNAIVDKDVADDIDTMDDNGFGTTSKKGFKKDAKNNKKENITSGKQKSDFTEKEFAIMDNDNNIAIIRSGQSKNISDELIGVGSNYKGKVKAPKVRSTLYEKSKQTLRTIKNAGKKDKVEKGGISKDIKVDFEKQSNEEIDIKNPMISDDDGGNKESTTTDASKSNELLEYSGSSNSTLNDQFDDINNSDELE